MKLGTSIEAEPRHLSYNKTRAHKKKKAATAVLFFIALTLCSASKLKILVSASPLINLKGQINP